MADQYKTSTLLRAWEHYLGALILYIILPLTPLIIERGVANSVSVKSLTLVAAIFTLTVGLSSRSILILIVGVAAGFAFGVAFGFVSGQTNPSSAPIPFAVGSIVAAGVVHAVERFVIHVIDRAPVLEIWPRTRIRT